MNMNNRTPINKDHMFLERTIKDKEMKWDSAFLQFMLCNYIYILDTIFLRILDDITIFWSEIFLKLKKKLFSDLHQQPHQLSRIRTVTTKRMKTIRVKNPGRSSPGSSHGSRMLKRMRKRRKNIWEGKKKNSKKSNPRDVIFFLTFSSSK